MPNHERTPDQTRLNSTETLLENPDIRLLYELCLTTEFADETAYLQHLLALVHACDLAYGDENAQHDRGTVVALAFALTDIHRQTGHYSYCSGELDFVFRNYSHDAHQVRREMSAVFEQLFDEVGGELPAIEICPVSARILLD